MKISSFIEVLFIGASRNVELELTRREESLLELALKYDCESQARAFINVGRFDLADALIKEIAALRKLAEKFGLEDTVRAMVQLNNLAGAKEVVREAMIPPVPQKKVPKRPFRLVK